MPFAVAWMDLESVILSEGSQRSRNIIWYPLYVASKGKWYKWTYLQNRDRLADLENELMVAKVGGWEKGIVKKFGMDMYTLLYLKCITNKDLLYSAWNCSMFCGSLDGRGASGRMDTCISVAEFLCWPTETITTLLISYAPIQNTKFHIKKNIKYRNIQCRTRKRVKFFWNSMGAILFQQNHIIHYVGLASFSWVFSGG